MILSAGYKLTCDIHIMCFKKIKSDTYYICHTHGIPLHVGSVQMIYNTYHGMEQLPNRKVITILTARSTGPSIGNANVSIIVHGCCWLTFDDRCSL